MLFTTTAFIFYFLPLVWAGFFAIGRVSHRGAALWLLMASVFFYGFWMPEYTLLLLASILGNYWLGVRIGTAVDADSIGHKQVAKRWLVVAVTANLALLSYYKYANFFLDNLGVAMGVQWDIGRVILPIGISFFTFTQIAYLVDTFKKGIRERNLVHYGLFVTYFPHLIAGPVLHHAQMMPQFKLADTYHLNTGNLTAGLAIFALGLFKKIVLADGISPYADPIFQAADAGLAIDTQEAWLGALAYTFQLYFDFSGYSDMAIGLSWMFNVRLPFNFNSPYKATNISDFWRRWHMTLSQFLRDYLYISLGGNRHGVARRYVNLMLTMVLGGLWHGASWSFVLWGFLHGTYLGINHGFKALFSESMVKTLGSSRVFAVLSWALTMTAVVVAWVVFRAETLHGAGAMLHSMAGLADADVIAAATHTSLWNSGLSLTSGLAWCAALGALALAAPNSNQAGNWLLAVSRSRATARWFIAGVSMTAIAFLLVVNVTRSSVSAFIYFNF